MKKEGKKRKKDISSTLFLTLTILVLIISIISTVTIITTLNNLNDNGQTKENKQDDFAEEKVPYSNNKAKIRLEILENPEK